MAIDNETKNYVLKLYFPENPKDHISAQKIIDKLEQENKVEVDKAIAEGKKNKGELKWRIPSLRTVYTWTGKAEGRITKEMEDAYKPWSMLLSDKAGIPFDRVLIKLLRLWFSRHLERGQGIPFVAFPVGIAKWAVRLHMVAPSLSEKELLYRARQYFNMERMDILTGREPDSIRDDLEIAIEEPDTDPKVKADYDQFYGVKKLVPQGKEVQTENGKVFEIEVAPDIVAKKIRTKKKTEPEIREELKHYGFDNTTIETVLARIKKRGLVNMRKNKQQKRRTET